MNKEELGLGDVSVEAIEAIRALPDYVYLAGKVEELLDSKSADSIDEVFTRWTDPDVMLVIAKEAGFGDDIKASFVVVGMLLSIFLLERKVRST